jgi:hypothetical protein
LAFAASLLVVDRHRLDLEVSIDRAAASHA